MLLLEGVLPLTQKKYMFSSVLLKGLGGFVSVPLYRVYFKSGIVSGPVVICVVQSLPVDGVILILHNDIAGKKVSADHIVVDNPVESSDNLILEKSAPGIFPSCAVTRSQSRDDSCNVLGDVSNDKDIL